jgi:medium-chain acyl-[acyl-carrier-protein] hydrolase
MRRCAAGSARVRLCKCCNRQFRCSARVNVRQLKGWAWMASRTSLASARWRGEDVNAKPCLVRLSPRPNARHRLYCFGWSGAGPAVYERWSRQLPHEVELVAVQLPGRAARRNERLQPRLETMSREIAEAISRERAPSAALFGHSLGALLAYDVALRLRSSDVGVEALIASASRGPTCEPLRRLHRLDDATLVSELVALGGIPAIRTHDRQFARSVLPVVRSDLTAYETYAAPRARWLDCPVVTWSGEQDWYAPATSVRRWAEVSATSAEPTRRTFPGGHFYIRSAAVSHLLADLRWPRHAPEWTDARARSGDAA